MLRKNNKPYYETMLFQKGGKHMNIEKLLIAEIESELEILNDMEAGSEEYKATVEGLTKLYDRALEEKRLDIECMREAEKMAEDRKNRIVQYALSAAGILIPTLVTIWGTNKSLKFEEEGTVTTIMGRGFISKLLPKK